MVYADYFKIIIFRKIDSWETEILRILGWWDQEINSGIMNHKLCCRCLTGFSIPTPLKLMIKTPEQYHAQCSRTFIENIFCTLVFMRIWHISHKFHKFMFPLLWTSKHCLGKFPEIEINRWSNTLFKFLSRKSFYIKKCFAHNKDDSRINEILHSVKIEVGELLRVKKGLDFTFFIV